VAVEKVTRVLVAVHQSERDKFLQRLQRLGLMHITQTEIAAAGVQPASAESRRVIQAIETLVPRAKKQKGATGRRTLSRKEYDRLAAGYDHADVVKRLEALSREQAELEARVKAAEAERRRLEPWTGLSYAPDELYEQRTATVILGKFPGGEDVRAAAEALHDQPAAIEVVGERDGEVRVLLAIDPASVDQVSRRLAEHRFEQVDLRNVTGRPTDVIAAQDRKAAEATERLKALAVEEERLAANLPELKVAADALANEEARETTAAALGQTESVSLIHGWVRKRHLKRIERLVAESGAAALTEVEPAPDEEPPVALVNRPVFRPFELVLELFSMPQPTELDPTWLVAPFFGVFFALCLTDAGYGIVLALLVYVLMRKLGTGNKLLGIILIGAILTIPAGALLGGWFGDMPDRLGIGWLQAFKNRLMWFDPVRDPMKFFILSIALGYLQLIVGIAFEIADCLRVRNYGDGLLGQLPWFVFLNALVARIVLAKSLPVWGSAALMVLIMAAVAAVLVFTQRSRETALSQTHWFALLLAFLLFMGTKLRWLPPEFGLAKWGFWAVYLGMFAHAVISTVKAGKLKPVPAGLGIAAAATLVLYFTGILPAWIPSVAGVLFFLLSPSNATVLAKFLWGGYALYGATSYVGVVLSYIRLMALGMCTGGVAVAINVIAWMLLPVPVVGIVLALIVLIFGHTYNIAVNVLGAFVHSLRLQYVEFFPRFYAGGGERFTPFRETNQFVSVK
jgi:V/A-type H+-transporting ATPase subunit I